MPDIYTPCGEDAVFIPYDGECDDCEQFAQKLNQLDEEMDTKQDILTAGEGIEIENNVISSTCESGVKIKTIRTYDYGTCINDAVEAEVIDIDIPYQYFGPVKGPNVIQKQSLSIGNNLINTHDPNYLAMTDSTYYARADSAYNMRGVVTFFQNYITLKDRRASEGLAIYLGEYNEDDGYKPLEAGSYWVRFDSGGFEAQIIRSANDPFSGGSFTEVTSLDHIEFIQFTADGSGFYFLHLYENSTDDINVADVEFIGNQMITVFPDVYYGDIFVTKGIAREHGAYHELPLTGWELYNTAQNNYQRFRIAPTGFEEPEDGGLSEFSHGTIIYRLDLYPSTYTGAYWDGEYVYLNMPTATASTVAQLESYMAAQKANDTPLAICYTIDGYTEKTFTPATLTFRDGYNYLVFDLPNNYASITYEYTNDITNARDDVNGGIVEGVLCKNHATNKSHAEGYATAATGQYSHSEGEGCIAAGAASHAEGYYTVALGNHSHAQNNFTVAQISDQTAIGKFNQPQGDRLNPSNTDYAFIIGNGSDDLHRSNAFAVRWDGALVLADGTVVTVAALKAALGL